MSEKISKFSPSIEVAKKPLKKCLGIVPQFIENAANAAERRAGLDLAIIRILKKLLKSEEH